jgi:PAS domain S-box-containing protein
MRIHIRPVQSFVVLTLLAVLVIAGAVSWLLWSLRLHVEKHAQEEAISLTRIHMEQTRRMYRHADLVLQGIQERLENPVGLGSSLGNSAVHLLLRTRSMDAEHLGAIALTDARGQVVNTSRDAAPVPISLADRDYFKFFAQGAGHALFIDKPARNRLSGNWSQQLARPVRDAQGRLRGVVFASLNLESYSQSLREMRLDMDRTVSLYTDDGTLMASSARRDNLLGNPAPELHGESLPSAKDPLQLVRHRSGDGSVQEFTLAHLRDYPYLISVSNNHDMAQAEWREFSTSIVLGTGLTILFIIVVAYLLVGEMQREENLSSELDLLADRYRQTVESAMDAIVAIDAQHHIVLFNPAAEKMFGRRADEVRGQHLSLLIPERFHGIHAQHLRKVSDPEHAPRKLVPQVEIVGRRADGSEFPIESAFSVASIHGEQQMTAVLRDVSVHRQAEAELRAMNTQLRELSASLQDVREQERSRIARELHDELGQQLTGLKLDLSWLRSRLREGRPADPEKLDDMKKALDDALGSVRRLSSDLRPPILDEQGFGDAVRWQAQELARRSGLVLHVDMPAADRVTDNHLATALFRITQEAMSNVVRYAQARQVWIGLHERDGQLVLTVRDDGIGFQATRRQGGIGLASMQERAMSMGGQFSAGNDPVRGAQITVSLPLDLPVFKPKS